MSTKDERAKGFYGGLHAKDSSYSAGSYHLKSLFRLRPVRDWFEQQPRSSIRLLDVGCGKGFFLLQFARFCEQEHKVGNIKATGVDLVQSPGNHFKEISTDFDFHEQNHDGATLPFADEGFDFLFCNHVLEHIFETEKLLREFRRILDPGGICVVSVPNIAAWINRIGLLMASQPLGSELGTERITYGFWPTSLQKKLSSFNPSGHIRDFTPRGLSDLAAHCGFKTVGWWAQSHGFIARLSKWAGRGIGIVLKRR